MEQKHMERCHYVHLYRETYEEVPFKRRGAIQTETLRFICHTDYTATKDQNKSGADAEKFRRTASGKKNPSLNYIVRLGKPKVVDSGDDRKDAMEGTGSEK
jgi:hypothetical protein